MTKKKITAAALAAILAVSALSGCGNDKENQNTENLSGAEETQGQDLGAGTEALGGTEVSGGTEVTEEQIPEPQYPEIVSDEKIEDFGSVVIVGDAAYELYTYSDATADNYALAVNKVAAALDQKADVYDILIPLGSGITFPDNLRDQIKSSDQREAMSSIQAKMDETVKTVDIYDSLMTNRNEYIYFRTDHHWTALGAYYAYEDFCEVKGITPEALDGYETSEFDGFLGSFYNDTNANATLKANADVVTAYHPNMDAIMHVTDSRGVEYDSKVIFDESKAAAGLKYSCFIAGDNPITEIENKELTDGSSCIVVKESFGNAFVPFLVDHYQTIYVVDYRYWKGSISELAQEKNVDDVIFVNNLSMIRNKSLVGKLFSVI
ncbi:MAG: DHHW family protein [Lachnospiraceae bacterium]|nr:DHHW family protein [Lachnospiraceae bacterium]